jgi:transposase
MPCRVVIRWVAGGSATHIRYRVELEDSERQQLEAIVAGGTRPVRRVKRAQILLAAGAGVSDAEIAATLQVGTSTVDRTKQHFVEHGVDRALAEEPRPGGKRKLTGTEKALLVATACAQPPAGRAHWTLLASTLVRLTAHTRVSRATVGRRLAENRLKPWQEKMWCVPQIDATYVARICRRIRRLPSTRHFRPPKRGACAAGSSSSRWTCTSRSASPK